MNIKHSVAGSSGVFGSLLAFGGVSFVWLFLGSFALLGAFLATLRLLPRREA